MHPDTFDVLKHARMANRDNFARSIGHELLANNVPSLADVDDNAQIVDELRDTLLGNGYGDHVIDELNEMIGEMTRPRGDVYDILPNGYTLCTAPVRRKTQTSTGATVIVQKSGRFVTDDDEVAAVHRLEPMVQRLERSMERAATTIADDVDRIPALAQRVPPMIARANRTMQAQLPAAAVPPQQQQGES